ncbi:MAG: 16S rRNA (cytosine(967)-C(5))-methyltransferase RsmB [Syntrophomonadaceae bacterium]|jgi:16S rRNA (cytosine967-C5)-methyltransferase
MDKDQDGSNIKVRHLAAQTVYRITENGAYTNLAIDKALRESGFDLVEKKLFTEIVSGSIRMLKHLDWVLNMFLNNGINRQNPWLRTVLRVSVYQMLFMDRIPDYAVVNDAVEICKTGTNQNLARVANGVLRNIARNRGKIEYPTEKVSRLATIYSHPEWIVQYLLDNFDEVEAIRIMEYDNSYPRVIIRCNTLKGSREDLAFIDLRGEGYLASISSLTPWGIILQSSEKPLAQSMAFKNGLFYIQNEASMLAGAILGPKENEIVFDLCAGVGGKATHMAELMNNQGLIYAFDLYQHKINLLRQTCTRLGISIIKANAMDVLNLQINDPEADRVLLDAPCTGLGVLNRRADARWRRNREDIYQLQKIQTELLNKAANLVKKGGLVLYATCTITEEENQQVVCNFLKNNDFALEGFAHNIEFFPLDDQDRNDAVNGMLTILPGKYNTDGMFYALMRRKYTD